MQISKKSFRRSGDQMQTVTRDLKIYDITSLKGGWRERMLI